MKKIILGLVIISAVVIVGCKPDELPPVQDVENSTMQIHVKHEVGGASLDFDSEFSLPSGEIAKFSRLDYILSDFYLVRADGSKLFFEDQYALVRAMRSESFTLVGVPTGDYTAFGFSIGLDSILNHGNPNQYASDHPLAPINNSLHWSWEGGYIFTAIEGKTTENNESFIFHLAGYMNKTNFELPISVTKGLPGLNTYLEYDVSEIFKNPSVYNISEEGAGTHSTSDPVTTKLFANMADVFALKEVIE